MQIDIKDIVEGQKNGEIVYVCDFRQPDLNKKPIRKVLPTKVLIVSNDETKEKIYYSHCHFVELKADGTRKAKIIKPYDNTGFRSYPGVPVAVFTEEQECIDFFNKQCDKVLDELNIKKETIVVSINREIEEVTNLKI